MREDMFKVIVERPRSGRSWATKSKLRYDRCEGRSRVSSKRLVAEHSAATGEHDLYNLLMKGRFEESENFRILSKKQLKVQGLKKGKAGYDD